jgi:hypothetical protein
MGSSTTNALAPVVKLVREHWGIRSGFFTTIHAYISSQSLTDQPMTDRRDSWAAAEHIIPSSSGAAKGLKFIWLDLNVTGKAYRVPVRTGSIVELTTVVERLTSRDEVVDVFRQVATTAPLKGVMDVLEEEWPSARIGGDPHSSLVEREHIGGTCVNEGCYPSKTMIASGRVAHLARRAADYGVHIDLVAVNLAEVRQRKRAIVERLRSGSEQYLAATEGLDLIFGQARFSGPKTLEVQLNSGGTRMLGADLIFINTGARPAMPPIEGIDTVRTLNSTTIMELDRVPEHLLILGGGYVGLEFGQLFRRSGSQVTIVQRGPQVLAHEDDDVAKAVAAILREAGVELQFDTSAMRAGSSGSDGVDLTVYTAEGARVLRGSDLLVAAGRTPNTEYLAARARALSETRGFIKAIVDAESGQILGAAILGVEGGEVLAVLQMAMLG